MAIRKTSEQIKEEILISLNKCPLSTEQLRKNIKDSNWSTINTYLKELSKEGKVKEIISTDKAKIYQKIFGDTYFDIPITDEERKKFKTLFYLIMQEYKSRGKIPTKTHLTKCAVDVIKSESSNLSNLPTIWYLYGMIPQMIADPSQNYQEEFLFEHKTIIRNLIKDYINKNGHKKSGQLQKEQHVKYGEDLYAFSDEFLELINKPNFENDKALKILNKFFIVCPIDKDFPEVFDLTEKFLSTTRKLALVSKLEIYRKEINSSFDALWKYISLYKLYESITQRKNALDKNILLKFYIGNALDVRKKGLEESLGELYSVYLSNIDKFNPESMILSKGAQEIRKIMEDWTGED